MTEVRKTSDDNLNSQLTYVCSIKSTSRSQVRIKLLPNRNSNADHSFLPVGHGGEDFIARPGSTGLATPVTDLLIVDGSGQQVPVGGIGEIWLHGPSLAKEYWNQPQVRRVRPQGPTICSISLTFIFRQRQHRLPPMGGSRRT